MILDSNARRHTDGSIDFDFYRRDTATRRSVARRLIIRHCACALRDTAKATFSAIGIALGHRVPPRESFS